MKLLLNSTVSDHTSKLSSVDVENFYLHSATTTPAYLSIPIRFLPPQTRELLQVTHLPNNASLLFEVFNAIYGMDDAGRISQQNLINHLAPHDYYMCRHTPGLFRHRTRPKFVFITWVDDFLIKSDPSTDDLDHFLTILALKYPIKVAKSASSYISYRISLQRHPTTPSLDSLTIDMRGYVNAGLEALGFTPTSKPAPPIS